MRQQKQFEAAVRECEIKGLPLAVWPEDEGRDVMEFPAVDPERVPRKYTVLAGSGDVPVHAGELVTRFPHTSVLLRWEIES